MSRFAHIVLSAWAVSLPVACVLPGPPTTVPETPATSTPSMEAEIAPTAPQLGDDPAKIEAYLRALEVQVEARRESYGDVRLHGSDEELAALNEQIDHLEQRFDSERERLWPGETELNSEAMAITGGVLTGVGVVGGSLGIFAAAKADEGSDPDRKLYVGLIGVATGVGTATFLFSGIPLLVIGAQQVPRKPSRHIRPPPVSLRFGADGVALGGSF